jgi:hypothetical protein
VNEERRSVEQILGAALVVVLVLVVAYFAFNQIPHSKRPTLHPATSVASTPPAR